MAKIGRKLKEMEENANEKKTRAGVDSVCVCVWGGGGKQRCEYVGACTNPSWEVRMWCKEKGTTKTKKIQTNPIVSMI